MENNLLPEERRERIRELLLNTERFLTGAELAAHFLVSRQVIVQDIALLRAKGEEIFATPKGYKIFKKTDTPLLKSTLVCQHPEEEVKNELLIMVDSGARVIDVIIHHPLYGELRGLLMIQNRDDVENFLENQKREGARLLSSLTEGLHLHTLEVLNKEVLKRVKRALDREGFLVY